MSWDNQTQWEIVGGSAISTEVASGVRTEIAAIDPEVPLGSVRVMEDLVDRSVARPRVTGVLMLIFAGLATLLAAVGLYGVLAYAVSRRAREIGACAAPAWRASRVAPVEALRPE